VERELTTEESPVKPGRGWARVWEWTKSVAAAVVLWFILSSLFVQAFHIPSGSMEGTLLSGDFLFANKALFGAEVPGLNRRLPAFREPRRFDIVIFDSVDEAGVNVVKRVIGMPGDTIAMQDNVVRINGESVQEDYVPDSDSEDVIDPAMRWQRQYVTQVRRGRYRPTLQNWGPLVVPADSFFVMGDNRNVSYDSRYWGFLGRDRIRGRPMIVYYSFDRSSKPFPALTGVRWRRLMTRPR
jgi:signal peptidase I